MRTALYVVVALVAAVAALVGTSVAGGQEAASTLSFQGEAVVGQPFEVIATVHAAGGAPIPGAEVTLTYLATFAGDQGFVTIAMATTDEDGAATLRFEPRVAGEYSLRAAFTVGGQPVEGVATATLPVSASGEQLYQSHPGIRVFAQEWILGAVVGAVWLALFAIALGIADIARSGAREGAEVHLEAPLDEVAR